METPVDRKNPSHEVGFMRPCYLCCPVAATNKRKSQTRRQQNFMQVKPYLHVFGLHLDLRCTSLNGHEKLIDLKFDSFKILVRNLDF
jgi:hypothetical protein